jgi:transglutaminase-like putative cysteine protease
LIGSGPELSSRVVMTVKVNNLAALPSGNQPLPLYWRGFTYDIYTGHGWSSSATKDYIMAANAELQASQAQGHLAISEEFFPVESLGGTVYTAGDPVRVNSDSEAAWRSPGDLFGIQTTIDTEYKVVSLVPVADEATLRQSGENYPDWIRQRFLTLPTEVPERVKALAIRLTETGIAPFDRAVAIEDYLRTFPYNLDVPIPPAQHDVTDYFLFDLKKGYCDYFATSMVVLSRLAGIPARLAIGYATGTYNLNSNRFSVSEADAHSWAELYFPGFGWIPFEATPSYPELDRHLPLPVEATTPGGNPPSKSSGLGQGANLLWFAVPGLVVGLFAALGIVWYILSGVRLVLLPEPVTVAEIYQRMKRMAILMGTHIESGDTPYEFLAAFSATLTSLTLQGLPESIIIHLTVDVQTIIAAIVQNRYRASGYSGRQIIREWLELRQRLWLVWALRKFGRLGIYRHSQTGLIT